jgi:hypothetical protein
MHPDPNVAAVLTSAERLLRTPGGSARDRLRALESLLDAYGWPSCPALSALIDQLVLAIDQEDASR